MEFLLYAALAVLAVVFLAPVAWVTGVTFSALFIAGVAALLAMLMPRK